MKEEGIENRRRVLEAIASSPGVHARELARQLDMHHSLVDYHVRFLAKNGLVVESADEGYKRYYPAYEAARDRGDRGLTIAERRWLGVLRRGRNVEIAIQVLLSPGMSLTQLGEAVGLSLSTLSSHMKRMAQAELVRVERAGKERRFYISQPSTVARLIFEHSWKRQDLVDSFAEVWGSMELRRG